MLQSLITFHIYSLPRTLHTYVNNLLKLLLNLLNLSISLRIVDNYFYIHHYYYCLCTEVNLIKDFTCSPNNNSKNSINNLNSNYNNSKQFNKCILYIMLQSLITFHIYSLPRTLHNCAFYI